MSEPAEEPARLRPVKEPKPDWKEWAMPIDFGILQSLPVQGSRLGYHVLGSTVKTIRQELNREVPEEAKISAGIIAQRITRWLRPKGLVVEVRVHGSGGAKGYQVTPYGERMLKAGEKEVLGG